MLNKIQTYQIRSAVVKMCSSMSITIQHKILQTFTLIMRLIVKDTPLHTFLLMTEYTEETLNDEKS